MAMAVDDRLGIVDVRVDCIQQASLYLIAMHPARIDIDDFLAQCRFRFSRASGPGGQHRNKVETHVTAEHVPTGLCASAGERRSQAENRKNAIQRLRCAIAVAVRTAPSSTPTDLSSLWQRYCRGGRIRIGETNPDFPAILAESLDRLAEHDWDPAGAGTALGVSATQIVGLAAQYPPALELLNQHLVARGRAPRVAPGK
jgi:hypothetical protein